MSLNEKKWFVYITEAENGYLYTGITTDLARRFSEHQTKQAGAKFFNISPPKKIVFHEPHSNRSSASKREASIKKLSRKEKIALIKQE
ncbi:MAG: GIY-YIG nuclease family protein [Methylophagaceae bacterium]